MFGCFRRGDANDPDIYVAAITAVLAEYPEEVVKHVTDPRTGIPRKTNFLPTVAEVDYACSERAAFCIGRDRLIAKGWKLEGNKWIKPEDAA